MKKSQMFFSAAALMLAGAAFADWGDATGHFDTIVLDNSKSGTTEVVITFTGDGVTQDAQLDLLYDAGLTVAKAEALQPGAVCVANPDAHGLRAVPPSGAGKALSTETVDVCKFSLSRAPSLAKSFKASSSISVSLAECSAPGKDVGSCASNIHDASK
jgi:hypothetical protein